MGVYVQFVVSDVILQFSTTSGHCSSIFYHFILCFPALKNPNEWDHIVCDLLDLAPPFPPSLVLLRCRHTAVHVRSFLLF